VITLHIFSNGRGFFDLGPDIEPRRLEEFREWWEKEGQHQKLPERLFFGGAELRVVEHPMPFGDVTVE
jgi:hypothetical protein